MTAAGRYVRAVPTLLRVGFAEMVAYRAEMVVWILTATLPLVMLALWDAAAIHGPLRGFGQTELARYFTTTLVIRQLTGAWIVWDLNYHVRTGSLSPLLLRPVSPLFFNLFETVAALPFRVIVLTPILAALVWWRPDIAFWPGLGQAALGALSTLLAFLIAWLVQAMFGMLAFWFEQSLGFFNLWFVATAILGGYLIPLPLLPAGVESAARWLPFQATLAAPIEILVGTAEHPARILGLQLCWLAVAMAGAWLLWRRGLARYGAVGA